VSGCFRLITNLYAANSVTNAKRRPGELVSAASPSAERELFIAGPIQLACAFMMPLPDERLREQELHPCVIPMTIGRRPRIDLIMNRSGTAQ
jgi:hypothetical protein